MNYFKPISISLSPNVQKDDVRLSMNLILRPWLWLSGKTIQEFEKSFSHYIGVLHAISFNAGRSALFAILQALELEQGSEVLLQAFTCNAVPNPVLWAGLTPIYVDCNKDDFTISLDDLKAKVTSKAKVLIVQHTFGLAADMDAIVAFCKEHNLILIEDCAHALGAEYRGKKVGTFGQAAFFSFSRDKVISSIYGGMATTNDQVLAEKLKKLQSSFAMPSRGWVFQQLLHPILLRYVILPLYHFFDIGKAMLVASQGIHLLSKAVSWQEKQGKTPPYFPKALPNALAILAYHQLNKVDEFNRRRVRVADYYYQHLNNPTIELPQKFQERASIFLRFTIKHPKAHEIIYDCWQKQNILIGDWYTSPIAPIDTNLEKMHYVQGSCPDAEALSKITLNLPTHVNLKERDVKRMVNFLNSYR